MIGTLIVEDGTVWKGKSFGYEKPISGELVFSTGMTGYPESLTDPSYAGQILVFTYPLIGNYGVPDSSFWESSRIHASAVIVSTYNSTPSHAQSAMSFSQWLIKEKIPALEIKDTRFIAKKIRDQGAMLGKIQFDNDIPFADPNKRNLIDEVSIKKPFTEGRGKKHIVLIDCGAKRNIHRSLLKRDTRVTTVPWNYDFFSDRNKYDGIIISNGPGDPKMAVQTIELIKKALIARIPTFGICLGNQILALAAGGDTYKMPFGHRGQNQPCQIVGTHSCYLTTQNHGFAVGKIPKGFKPWFINLNDKTNEGIVHNSLPFMSVQFHPESTPGPADTDWLFDHFINLL